MTSRWFLVAEWLEVGAGAGGGGGCLVHDSMGMFNYSISLVTYH
jgi:hypothetical protein